MVKFFTKSDNVPNRLSDSITRLPDDNSTLANGCIVTGVLRLQIDGDMKITSIKNARKNASIQGQFCGYLETLLHS